MNFEATKSECVCCTFFVVSDSACFVGCLVVTLFRLFRLLLHPFIGLAASKMHPGNAAGFFSRHLLTAC